jgi:predicted transcriptional regulator
MLLSINPEHVENILCGRKKFEFRKVRCRSDIDKIVIYATSPVMRIIGEADVINIIVDSPEKVWEQTSIYSGISKSFFDKYYHEKDIAIAYELSNVEVYEEPLTLEDVGLSFAPQSFVYLS